MGGSRDFGGMKPSELLELAKVEGIKFIQRGTMGQTLFNYDDILKKHLERIALKTKVGESNIQYIL